jgi:pimeloyl-[acyl-carrier protein] methyl ester esterase
MHGAGSPALHATESGHGRPVLLVHGWGASGRSLDALAARLSGRARVVVVDLPGHGRSPPSPAAGTIEAMGERVAALVRERGLSRAIVGGWSLGAMVAVSAADRLGDDAAGLLLLSATPRFAAGDGWEAGLPAEQVDGLAARLRISPAKALARFFGACLVDGELPADARAAALAILLSEPPDPGSARAGLAALAAGDLRPLLSRAAPALLVHGDRDAIVPPGASEAMARAMPAAHRVLLPGVGHAPQLSRPGEVAAACLEFLAGCPA